VTPDESIQFAQALPEQNVYDRLQMLQEVLYTLEYAATPRILRQARKHLLDNAEAFRRADTPGHATWYERQLRAAAFASERWQQKAEGLSK